MRVKEAYQDLCEKQERLFNDPSQANILEELDASARWHRISDIEENVLKQNRRCIGCIWETEIIKYFITQQR